MKKVTKKQVAIITMSIVFILIAVVSVTFIDKNKTEMKIDNESTTVEKTTESTTRVGVEESTASTTESTTVKAEIEATTKKVSTTKAETTTKKVTTTKAETTTKKNTEGTFNGHKPYEVFTDANGVRVYYNENGRLCNAESLTAKPNYDYDNSYCHKCGSKDCIRAMSSYHCAVCDKDIPALECHSKSHYEKSH